MGIVLRRSREAVKNTMSGDMKRSTDSGHATLKKTLSVCGFLTPARRHLDNRVTSRKPTSSL